MTNTCASAGFYVAEHIRDRWMCIVSELRGSTESWTAGDTSLRVRVLRQCSQWCSGRCVAWSSMLGQYLGPDWSQRNTGWLQRERRRVLERTLRIKSIRVHGRDLRWKTVTHNKYVIIISSFHWNELMQSRGVRRPSVCPSVCLSVNFAQIATSTT